MASTNAVIAGEINAWVHTGFCDLNFRLASLPLAVCATEAFKLATRYVHVHISAMCYTYVHVVVASLSRTT